MKIYVRHVNRSFTTFLHEGTLEDANAIMSDMRVNGVVSGDRDRESEISGQWVIDEEDNDAFFEIVVGDQA